MKKCINCNTIISNRNKFCSIQCQKEYEYKNYIDKWKQGKVDGLRGKYQISMYIRSDIFYKCTKCGWSQINPYTNNIPLEIEHVDGNYLNNTEENLILLCPNCHSLTSTYKGANLNHGRRERSKYK